MTNSFHRSLGLWLVLGVLSWLLALGAEAREVRVGMYENAPKIFTNALGQPDGIFIDLLQAIALQEDWQLQYVHCEWDHCLKQLADGHIDLMPDVAWSAERDGLFDFHQSPALHSWSQIYVRLGHPIGSVSELNGKRVAILQDSVQEKEFDTLMDKFDLSPQMVPCPTMEQVFERVQSGKADAAVTNHYFGDFNAHHFGLKSTPIVFQPVHLFFATTQGKNQALLSRIDTQLDQWQQDKQSEYFAILNKWNNDRGSSISPLVQQSLLFVTLLFLMTGMAALFLRQRLRKRTQHLQATKDQLETTLEALPDLMFEIDQNGRYLSCHSPRSDLYAAPPVDMLGKTVHEVLPADAADTCMAAIQEANQNGTSQGKQIELRLAEGLHCFELSVSRKPLMKSQLASFIVLSRDITARRQAEQKLVRLTKLYAALSQCNQAIVRCETESELFAVICKDVVEFGGMKMAWIGQLDKASGRVKPVSSYGAGVEYLNEIEISIDPNGPKGQGPTGTALRENHPYWCQDFQHAPETEAWHERGARFGWGASAALPLTCNNAVVGAFTLYASEINAFDEAAQNLLIEMAMDISYALDRFNARTLLQQTAQALHDKDDLYRTAFMTSHDAINITRLSDGMYLDVNEGFERITGWKREETIGKTSIELNIWKVPEDRERLVATLQQQGSCENLQAEFGLKDGSSIIGLMSARIIEIKGESCLLSITRDITHRMQAESSLRRLTQAVEQSPVSIVITDLEANIEYVNSTFTKVSGYALEEVQGKNPRILQSGKTPKSRYDEMWACLTAGEDWRGELINRSKDGNEYIESALISPVRDANGNITHYLAINQNVTEKKRDEEKIQQLAHFDQLTGLPNRTLLGQRFSYALSLAQRNNESLAVMFLDLDHFKNINDTLGHSVGDRFLMEVANRLASSIRDEDTVSRLGGDEFILVFPGTDADGAALIASKLIASVSKPYQIEHHELIGTPSIGIAIYPNDGDNFEDLLKNADTAMYRVKQDSRNDFRFFTAEMQSHSERNLQLVNAMRHALARNEFEVHYQPQVTLRNGNIIGAEALLRWHHPELGTISPAEFIPIAEDSGQIIPISEWVLRTAVKQMKEWHDSGLSSLVIAVNLSAVQFRQPNLPELVARILEEAQLPPDYLELELTEAVAMDDPQTAVAVMDDLFDRGVRMSIDDFGTGYSSLSYLKRFKVYKLKIDQSFVRDISDDPEDKAIVTAIINLASSLGMHTIAEGVETASQLAFLRLQGCDEVQGYYFSKPLPADEFESFARNTK